MVEEFLTLANELALVDQELHDATILVFLRGSDESWNRLNELQERLDAALLTDDFPPDMLLRERMNAFIKIEESVEVSRITVMELIEKRTQLLNCKRELLSEMGQMLTVDQAFSLLDQVVAIVRKNVEDQELLASIPSEP